MNAQPSPRWRCLGAAVSIALFRSASALASPALFTDATLTTPGLVGSYVDQSLETVGATDDWRTTQAICGTRIDPVLEFATADWGSRAAVGVTGGADADWENFSVQWDGWLQVTEAGQRYATVSDDGSRLWLDLNNNAVFEPEELLNNGWGRGQGPSIRDRSRALAVGVYRIRIQYTGWHEGVNADFYHLMRSQGEAALVNAGAVDEVWCFGDHYQFRNDAAQHRHGGHRPAGELVQIYLGFQQL